MIGNTDPTTRLVVPINPELAQQYSFDKNIAIQLAKVAAALKRLSEIGDADYAQRHTIESPELVSELATFLSAITSLNAYKEMGQRVLIKLVSNEKLTEGETIFLEQIQHVSLPADTMTD